MPGASLSARRRLGSATLPPVCWPGRAIFPWLVRPIRLGGAGGGVTDKCGCEFEHSMSVTRIYGSAARDGSLFRRILVGNRRHRRSGRADLQRLDVRWPGGEPTFVSVDDPTGPSGIPRLWGRPSASSARRCSIADCVMNMRRLVCAITVRAEWYPGEQLPRWSLNIYWRRDGGAALVESESGRR